MTSHDIPETQQRTLLGRGKGLFFTCRAWRAANPSLI
jgi:hypothetical protein